MKKRCLRMILCVGACLALMTTAVSAAKFSDVASTAYYAAPVAWAVSQNITGGTTATTFSPNNTCTRAHIITFLWRAAGSPDAALGYNPFSDVAENAYYYKAAVWAMVKGIQPAEAGRFNPSTPCTRLAALEYIWRYAGSPAAEKVAFTDLPSGEAGTAISWGVSYGVTGGKTATTFAPKETCTRAQIVTFLYRYFVAPIETQQTVPSQPSASAQPTVPATPSTPSTSTPTSSDMDLDPLPPSNLSKQAEWYQSLTDCSGMSNARLIAEYERIGKVMEEGWSSGADIGDAIYDRELDLWNELSRRSEIVARYDSNPSGSAKQEFDELVAQYGNANALRGYGEGGE